MSKPICYI